MVLNTEEFAQNMLSTLPKFYLAEDIKQNNTLRRFLMSAFIGGTDDLIKSINGVGDFSDPLKCPSEDLPALCESWGITYEPSIPEIYQRKLLSYIGELYKRKGTYSCIKFLVRTVTGCDCDLIYSEDKDTGERNLDVVVVAKSIQDITTGKIEEDTYAVQKILPRFLPFYLIPKVSYSSPRNPVPTPIRYTGERLSQYIRNDLTPKELPVNLFLNADFSSGTSGWLLENSDTAILSVSSIIGPSSTALSYTPKSTSLPHSFYQDIDVIHGDKLKISFKTVCPQGGVTLKVLYTFYRKDNTVIHSILSDEIDLSIKGLWKTLKRTLYVSDTACTKIRVKIYSDTENLEVQMTSPVACLGNDTSINVKNPTVTTKTVGNSEVTLKWNSVNRVSSYRVYYRPHDETEWRSEDVTSTSCYINELSNGKKYEFAVCSRTVNGFNRIQSSDIFTLTTTA